MKAFAITVICLLVLGGLVGGHFSYTIVKENATLKNKIASEQDKNKTFVLYEKCINSMAKTLMVAYGLSKWEAHYYSVVFYDFSKNYNIPWEIYPAVTRIESNFKCNVGSPKGAKGMMQLLEGTGKEVADNIGIDYVVNQTLWNTLVNIVLGCTYLSKNINDKGLEGGVKSYLGGPDYLKSMKANKDANQYIGEYKSTVWKEYKELSYIFRGVVEESDRGVYKEIHPFLEPAMPTNIELFIKDTIRIASQEAPIEKVKGETNDTKPIGVRKKPIRTRPAEVIGTPDSSNAQ